MSKVVVGLSGGVDSSVAAHLLIEQGHEVIALYMQNWHDTTGKLEGDCSWEEDKIMAKLVAKKLGIPFHYVDLSEKYTERVVDYMFSEYQKGRTPNPDVLCNREIKFDAFLEVALTYGADYVATGHYCRKEEEVSEGKTIYKLLAGIDKNKDQSYFLCQLNQKQLSKALFPIGNIEKPEVRRIAAELNLPSATKKDSQGICFVGKIDLPTFLQQKLKAKEGKIIELPKNAAIYDHYANITCLADLSKSYNYQEDQGKIAGMHHGAHFFTIGQRKGLNVGGTLEPLYVLSTDIEKNIVYVGQGQDHPGLFRKALFIRKEEIHWIRPDLKLNSGDEMEFELRIRYRQPLQKGKIIAKKEGLYLLFDEAQRGITAGQFAAWYKNGELLGSGVISE